MLSRILAHSRRRRPILCAVAAGCVGTWMLAAYWPHIERRYAAQMMRRAVMATPAADRELEGSFLLSSAIDRVKYFEAQDEALAALIPLLKDSRFEMRAKFCILYMNVHSPFAADILVGLYRDPLMPARTRVDKASILAFTLPQIAEQCGAAAVSREYSPRFDSIRRLGDEDGDVARRRLLERERSAAK